MRVLLLCILVFFLPSAGADGSVGVDLSHHGENYMTHVVVTAHPVCKIFPWLCR
ncbi:hypothetical protein RQN30_03320 [Arcanobacterium hippocoleae]